MTDNEVNRLRMYRKVKGFGNSHQEFLSRYAKIGSSYGTFVDFLDQLEKVNQAQAGAVTNNAKTKEELKEEMSILTIELASSGFVYARETNNADLQGIFDLSYSELRYADDQSAHSIATAVHSALAGELANLGEYMVSQEDLDTLLGITGEYKARLENNSSQDSVALTKQLKGLFRKTSDHLKYDLDKLMLRVKRKEPVIYDAYVNARQIVDLGGTRQQSTPDAFDA